MTAVAEKQTTEVVIRSEVARRALTAALWAQLTGMAEAVERAANHREDAFTDATWEATKAALRAVTDPDELLGAVIVYIKRVMKADIGDAVTIGLTTDELLRRVEDERQGLEELLDELVSEPARHAGASAQIHALDQLADELREVAA